MFYILVFCLTIIDTKKVYKFMYSIVTLKKKKITNCILISKYLTMNLINYEFKGIFEVFIITISNN